MSTTNPAAIDPSSIRPPAKLFSGLGQFHFLFRRLHSLTGIAFGLYLFLHLGINATLAEGARHDGSPTVFQQQVDKIHSTPFLTVIEIVFLYFPLAYHTLYGLYIVYTGQSNVGRYGYTRNWLYLLQRVSAMVILFFALFHIFTMKGWLPFSFREALEFRALDATRSTAQHLVAAWWIWGVAYPIGVLASAFHTVNGFYAAAITWGLTISARAQKRWGIFCIVLFFGLFGAGVTALVAGVLAAQSPAINAPSGANPIHVPAL